MSLILRSKLGKSAGGLGRASWQALRFPIRRSEDICDVYKSHCFEVRFVRLNRTFLSHLWSHTAFDCSFWLSGYKCIDGVKILKTSPDNAYIATLALAKPKSKNGTKVDDQLFSIKVPLPEVLDFDARRRDLEKHDKHTTRSTMAVHDR